MISKVYLYPYKTASVSSKLLAEALGGKRIKHLQSRFKPGPRKMLINWGASYIPEEYLKYGVLNHPDACERATDKHQALLAMDPMVTLPLFTTDRQEALQWLLEGPVVCRTQLKGYGGAGIHIAETEQEMVASPLYTKYIKKKSEWRVHIFCEEVLMVQRKVRDMDVPVEDVQWRVRNHANGFVFQQHGDKPPICVIKESAAAIKALGLDFGAVDVVYNSHHDEAYVLEVNTAPGLVGTTLERYTNKILSLMEG